MRRKASYPTTPVWQGGASRRALRLGLLMCGVGAIAAPAAAQSGAPAPRAPTREEVERPPAAEPVRRSRLTIEGDVERAPCALDGENYRGIRFTPREVQFRDLRGLAPEALRAAYEPYLGREQPIGVVCQIRDRASAILRQAGYIASVEIPEQRIADGVLRFDVLMARVVAIRVRGDAGKAERTIAGYLEKLTRQEAFNRYDAERYLLLAGDLPGYDVRLALRSARAGRGEVIGEVTVVHRAADVDLNVQNFGSNALGRWGALLLGQAYGLTGLGDRTTVAVFSTLQLREQQTLQIGHEMRIGSEGLTLSGQFTYSWAHPDLGDPAIDLKARTLLATAEASFPFVRTQAQTVRGAAGFDLVNQHIGLDGLDLSQDRLRVAFARVQVEATDPASLDGGLDYTASEPRWRFGGRIELRQGLSVLNASPPCGPAFARCTAPGAVPPSHLEGDATATVLRAAALGEYRPSPKLTLALGGQAQWAAHPLLSFEEFAAGNYTVGRGYDPGVLLGDRGAGLQAELRYGSAIPANRDAVVVQPFAFLDVAWVSNEDRAFAVTGRQRLSSLGGGVRAAWGDHGRLEVTLAVPMQRVGLQTERPDPRLLVSFTTKLTPWSFK